MDVKNLSQDTLISTLEGLLKIGKITEGDLFLAMTAEPSLEMKHTVDLIHSIMCTEGHGKDATGSGRVCEYYVEDNLAEAWKLPVHIKWLKNTAELMKEYNLATLLDLKNAIKVVTAITEDLRKRAAVNPHHFRFISMLLMGMLNGMVKKGLTPSEADEPKQLAFNLQGEGKIG